MDKEVLWIDAAKIPDGVSFDKFIEDFNKLGVWSQQAMNSFLENYKYCSCGDNGICGEKVNV